MSCSPEEIERLERALDTSGQHGGTGAGAVDPGTLWDAVEGRLPPEDLARLAERAATDPSLRREWKMALHLSRERGTPLLARRERWEQVVVVDTRTPARLGEAWDLIGGTGGPSP